LSPIDTMVSYSKTTPIQSQPAFERLKIYLLVFIFGLLFFLCCADQIFATRIFGLNFRWGQLLLLVFALISLWHLIPKIREGVISGEMNFKILLYWMPFFVLYGLAAFSSDNATLTALKWGWGMFNIGAAALVCLCPLWSRHLQQGFKYGILLMASFIWLQALLIYWLGITPQPLSAPGAWPLTINWISDHFPLGFAQPTWMENGIQYFRPNGYYYEPSYAGCSLAIGFSLFLLVNKRISNLKTAFFSAVVFSAVILTSARSGILAVFSALIFIIFLSLLKNNQSTFKHAIQIALMVGLLIGFFCFSDMGKKYIGFLMGPLGPKATIESIHYPDSSAGSRLTDVLNGLRLWSQHLILGNGIPVPQKSQNGLGQTCQSTWVEVGVESGLLGFLAFLGAVIATMREARKHGTASEIKTLLTAAWVSQFIVALNLTGTYPRLDYWLLFFFSISLSKEMLPIPTPDSTGITPEKT
jgi:hypothetical protein